jgi:hypothetical protein
MSDVSDFTIHELVNELKKRTTVCLVMLEQPTNKADGAVQFYTEGSNFILLGMLEIQKARLLKIMMDCEDDIQE